MTEVQVKELEIAEALKKVAIYIILSLNLKTKSTMQLRHWSTGHLKLN